MMRLYIGVALCQLCHLVRTERVDQVLQVIQADVGWSHLETISDCISLVRRVSTCSIISSMMRIVFVCEDQQQYGNISVSLPASA